MGDEPSGGGGGGGATTSSFQMAVAKAEDKEKKRKQEEAMMRMAESEDDASYYVRAGSSGNVVRSSSGSAVTSRAGRQAQENVRAGMSDRDARDMDAEFPIDTDSNQQIVAGQTTIAQKTSAPASRAARRLLAQNQKNTAMRQFYN